MGLNRKVHRVRKLAEQQKNRKISNQSLWFLTGVCCFCLSTVCDESVLAGSLHVTLYEVVLINYLSQSVSAA